MKIILFLLQKYFFNTRSMYLLYDRTLLWLLIGISCVGFVMVASSSMYAGFKLLGDSFYFIKQYLLYFTISLLVSVYILQVPINVWQKYSSLLLFVVIIMLFMVLFIGPVINGSFRWIVFGFLHIQPSELLKLSWFFYLSNYLTYKYKLTPYRLWAFSRLIGIMLGVLLLLLIQPDFGSIIIIFVTTLLVLFLAGIKLWKLFLVILFGIMSGVLLIITTPYRIQRIISFWNPWLDPFGGGYQLTQSLIAFGRGKLYGQGLGNSVQKLEYLPESHTDFIFAIIGEELGCIGSLIILIMLFSIIFRILCISRKAFNINESFFGFFSFSVAIWISLQTLINVGVTIGLLPTKGLTLPFISYGGSSFLIMFITIMFLLRIDFELRISTSQAFMRD